MDSKIREVSIREAYARCELKTDHIIHGVLEENLTISQLVFSQGAILQSSINVGDASIFHFVSQSSSSDIHQLLLIIKYKRVINSNALSELCLFIWLTQRYKDELFMCH